MTDPTALMDSPEPLRPFVTRADTSNPKRRVFTVRAGTLAATVYHYTEPGAVTWVVVEQDRAALNSRYSAAAMIDAVKEWEANRAVL